MKSIKPLILGPLLLTSIGAHPGIALASTALVINEIDYDQTGTDNAEFVELYNNSDSTIVLDGYHLNLVNGNDSSSYRDIDLSGFEIAASSFFVVCSDNGLVANCDYGFTSTTGWFQNGAPDAIALYQQDSLVDSLAYEGLMALYTEGNELALADDGLMSIGRVFDGVDTDNNALDFQISCITPGTANIGGTGDCSSLAVSPVPVPAAVWLFASGLGGLGLVSRRKNRIKASS